MLTVTPWREVADRLWLLEPESGGVGEPSFDAAPPPSFPNRCCSFANSRCLQASRTASGSRQATTQHAPTARLLAFGGCQTQAGDGQALTALGSHPRRPAKLCQTQTTPRTASGQLPATHGAAQEGGAGRTVCEDVCGPGQAATRDARGCTLAQRGCTPPLPAARAVRAMRRPRGGPTLQGAAAHARCATYIVPPAAWQMWPFLGWPQMPHLYFERPVELLSPILAIAHARPAPERPLEGRGGAAPPRALGPGWNNGRGVAAPRGRAPGAGSLSCTTPRSCAAGGRPDTPRAPRPLPPPWRRAPPCSLCVQASSPGGCFQHTVCGTQQVLFLLLLNYSSALAL